MIKPSIFGKFILLERISVGGMAEVYRAKLLNQPQFGRYFALKRILPNLAADEEFIKMFVNEASVAVELEHPNVCQIYELGRLGSSHYIAMEYISGRDFAAIQNYYRRQKKIMSVSQACFIVAQAAQGLDYAHKAVDQHTGEPLRLVHRDISPQNLIADFDGVVKLIDFGVAKASRRTTGTKSGALKGKFSYMSPEQAADTDIDHRSDIFALGVIFWELLTGRRLFVSESEYAILEMIKECNIEKPSKYNHTVPEVVDRICMKALERDPNKRYAWAGDMILDLVTFIQGCEPPYSMWHLSTWLQTTFAEIYEEEKRKKAIFDTLNTEEDVERYNRENAEKLKKEEEEAEKKAAQEAAEKANAPKLPPVPGRLGESAKEGSSLDLSALPAGRKSLIASKDSLKEEAEKKPAPSHPDPSGFDDNDLELEPEAVAPTVSDPEHLRMKRIQKKNSQRKHLTAVIIATCIILDIVMILLLTNVIGLKANSQDLTSTANLTVTVFPETADSEKAKIELFPFPQNNTPAISQLTGNNVTFTNLEPTVYTISVEVDGFEPEFYRVPIEKPGSSSTKLELLHPKTVVVDYTVTVSPENAKLYVDDTLVEGSGALRTLSGNQSSTHTLRVTAPGYMPNTQVVTIDTPETTSIKISLEETTASLQVLASEPSDVFLCSENGDCEEMGPTPFQVDEQNAISDKQIVEVRSKQRDKSWKKAIHFEDNPHPKLFADLGPVVE